jgi:hypothetical protein
MKTQQIYGVFDAEEVKPNFTPEQLAELAKNRAAYDERTANSKFGDQSKGDLAELFEQDLTK